MSDSSNQGQNLMTAFFLFYCGLLKLLGVKMCMAYTVVE